MFKGPQGMSLAGNAAASAVAAASTASDVASAAATSAATIAADKIKMCASSLILPGGLPYPPGGLPYTSGGLPYPPPAATTVVLYAAKVVKIYINTS